MTREKSLALFLLLSFLGLIFGMFYLNNPDVFEADEEQNVQVESALISYPVNTGEIIHTYEVEAQVIFGDSSLYVSELVIENANEKNIEFFKNKGEDFSKKEVLCTHKGKKIFADFNGKIVDVDFQQGNIVVLQLLNYDNLYILTQIDSDKVKKISYDTGVVVSYDGKALESTISQIGYEFVDGKLPVHVCLPENLLPGSKVTLTFTLDVDQAGMYVSADAVYQDGETYYVTLQEDDEIRHVKVDIGQKFSVLEDGNEFKYIEILSGIEKDDILVVERVDTSGSEIKESLKYG